jgi:CRP-like cAMP-binding protein
MPFCCVHTSNRKQKRILMLEAPRPPTENQIIAALPPEDYERLARWLLMSHDRTVSEKLKLTQEFIATMLGTRRAGVTEAAVILQAEGFIKYKRGHITIEDRKGLEDFTCECYGIIKAEFDRLPI